jgi:DNA ligase 1
MTTFKPLLAATCEDISTLRYPVLASPKLDGIRCVKLNGKAFSRKLKPIPNDFVRTWIESNLPDGIDGELMLRDHRASFSDVSSAIMSRDGEPDFQFCAFDLLLPALGSETIVPFKTRFGNLIDWARAWQGHERLDRSHILNHALIANVEQMRALVDRHAAEGFEGTMVRHPEGRYKFGRSTVKEGILLKIKAFADEEATVIGVVEQMHNANEATVDNLGHTKRSSAKAGKRGTGKLGALVCRLEDGTEFEIGSGFTDAQRIELWELAGSGKGAPGPVKFKHQPPPGGRQPGEKPRFPVFLGWRED